MACLCSSQPFFDLTVDLATYQLLGCVHHSRLVGEVGEVAPATTFAYGPPRTGSLRTP